MANKFKGNITLPQAQNTDIKTLFNEEKDSDTTATDNTFAVPRRTLERKTAHKDIALKPSTLEDITVIALAKGYSVNDYISTLIETDIDREADNMHQYKIAYKQIMAKKKQEAEERKAKKGDK